MALKRVWIKSPNYYSGNNGRRLLIVHSSEGAQSYQDLGNFFANSSSQVSSHVGIDNKSKGTIGEYVRRGDSAWTAANANMVAVQAELCTPSGASANWSRDTWLSKTVMLDNLAQWLKEESQATGIPLVELTPAQAQGSGRGVCEHKDLGAWGGGHVDCGPGFPLGHVIDMAKGNVPSPSKWNEGVEPVICSVTNPGNGNLEVFEVNSGGALWHRWWVASSGSWAKAVKMGDGYIGSPSAEVNANNTINVFVQRDGGVDCWSLGSGAGANWTKKAI